MASAVRGDPAAPGAQTWRLRDLAPADRGEGWRDVVCRTHLSWQVDAPPVDLGRPFDAAVRRRRYAEVDLLDCRCDPCAGGRSRAEVDRTDGERVGVLAVLAGREILEQDGRQVELRAGDVALWDSRRPARFAVLEPLRKRTLLLPHAAVAAAAPGTADGRAWTARAVPRRALVRTLLAAHLEALASPGPGRDAGELAARVAAELVAAAMSLVARGDEPALVAPGSQLAPEPVPPTASAGRRDALLRAVFGTIDRRLAEVAAGDAPLHPRELSPGSLAAAHAISVRTLHQVAEGAGEGIAARVRRLRLEGARRELSAGGAGSIASTAARWGFSDAAHFTRAYRELFGERPRDTVERSHADRAALA